ncbi:LCP family protein [Ornithinibacillus sp. FSL M8-0202]|uniref:LCP family protein n=1 Tax=Ornithinibacillus sp. FSL M8-0202 TaxID=2921616 RepID=UPI0030CC9E90
MVKQDSDQSRMVQRKKKRKLRKRVFILLVPLLVIFAGVGYAISLYIKADAAITDSYEDDGREKSKFRDVVVDPNVDNVSILIIGVDESDHRANEGNSRSDALILATLNKKDKSVKLLSIPRDSYVYIPEVGYEDKIAHAHAFGGVEASIETVENLLEIPVDYYVKVNFHAFVEVIDAIGGITVEVPYEFWESNSEDKKNSIHLLPGEQVLDGEEALALARTRKLDNDIERGKRQMEIIKAVVKESMSASSILKLGDVIDAVGSNMTTNMTFDEMTSLVSYALNGDGLDIESMTVEGSDYQPGSIYYWQLDQTSLYDVKTLLKNHLELESTDLVKKSIDVDTP